MAIRVDELSEPVTEWGQGFAGVEYHLRATPPWFKLAWDMATEHPSNDPSWLADFVLREAVLTLVYGQA